MDGKVYDLAIIGGGINGAGIAADAAGRGLSVVLLEQGDLGGATSSASSKLIHGGLRYLEHYEFRLVKESLAEREVLLAKAPHIIWPLRFVIPHGPGMRPPLLIRAGLFLYDHLAARRAIPDSQGIDLRQDMAGRPLKEEFRRGFAYWDCWADDARLVVLNARDAARRGAEIQTRTRVTDAAVKDGLWIVRMESHGEKRTVAARALVNAAGPWAAGVLRSIEGAAQSEKDLPRLRLVKGSHIVLPRVAGAEDAYLFQNPDGRVVFMLPYEERFTLIGTTDVPYEGDPGQPSISASEEAYLIDAVSRFLRRPVDRAGIRHSYAGVRPLFDDGQSSPSAVSRDYRLELVQPAGQPPLLSVFGGKITTYRKLAEAALEKLRPSFPRMGPAWTSGMPLPGGDTGAEGLPGYRLALERRYPYLDPAMLARLVRRYGTLTRAMLGDAKCLSDLGPAIAGGLTKREVLFLKETEWAREPDDVLWRRTKAGLHAASGGLEAAREAIARLL